MFHFLGESHECLPILFQYWISTLYRMKGKKGAKYIIYVKLYESLHLSSEQHSSDLDDGQSRFSSTKGATSKAPDGERVNSPSDIFIHGLSTSWHKKCPQLARILPSESISSSNFYSYVYLSAKVGLSICMGIESKYQARQMKKIKSASANRLSSSFAPTSWQLQQTGVCLQM